MVSTQLAGGINSFIYFYFFGPPGLKEYLMNTRAPRPSEVSRTEQVLRKGLLNEREPVGGGRSPATAAGAAG